MVWYMRIGFKKTVNHTITLKGTPRAYCVHGRKNSIAYDFIVVASSADDAIEALKSNAFAVIAEIRKECKPEDMDKHQVFRDASIQEGQQAARLEEEAREFEEQLLDIEDREDDLSQVRRETLNDNIKKNHQRARELRAPKPFGNPESVFEQRTGRMSELLSMTLTAEELSTTRAYPVSYFDDSRSIC